jgi:hypothetical protein
MPEPVRLVLPPSESARLAAVAPGEVVEVRCGEPLPEIPPEYEYVVNADGGDARLLALLKMTEDRPHRPWVLDEPQPPHPAPAVGAEVEVEVPPWHCRQCGWRGWPEDTDFDDDDDCSCPSCGSTDIGEEQCYPEEDFVVRATVTALGAARWCGMCRGDGHVRGRRPLPGTHPPATISLDCPTCQGSPPWWATATLRRLS